jgi:hypothetical protein
MKAKRNAKGQFVKARKAAAKRKPAGPGLLAATAMRRRYGARALQVAARLRNLARTKAQRAHWSKVIRALEKKKPAKKAKRNPAPPGRSPYKYLVSQAGTHLARFLTKVHAMQYAQALANKSGRQVRVTA